MGVGAGIVLDSVAADEYAECQLKARFLTGADPGFELFETMYATREAGFGIRPPSRADFSRARSSLVRVRRRNDCATLVDDTMRGASTKASLIVCESRLSKSGEMHVDPRAARAVGRRFRSMSCLRPITASRRESSSDPLLRHKTTRRAEYDRAWHEAEALGAFDMLFFNERGELTEGGRTNVFVKLDGRWWTPPIDAGVLPGVMRAVLMEELSAVERPIKRDELERAEALIVCNALRGAVKARLRLSKP